MAKTRRPLDEDDIDRLCQELFTPPPIDDDGPHWPEPYEPAGVTVNWVFVFICLLWAMGFYFLIWG